MTTVNDTQTLGSTWSLIGPLQDKDGNPIPLAGATIEWELATASARVLRLSETLDGHGSGITVLDGPTSTVALVVEPGTQTDANVSAMTYRHAMRVTLPDGTVHEPIETSNFVVTPSLFVQFP